MITAVPLVARHRGGTAAPPPGGYGAPPPGGFGAPPPGGYGAPPVQPYGMQPAPAAIEGNLALGFLAGFFGGCFGLILVHAIAKGPQTKRGAGIGFAVQIVVGALLRLAAR